MRQRESRFRPKHRREDIAPFGGLREDLLDNLPIQTVSTGMAFMIRAGEESELMKSSSTRVAAQRYLDNSDANSSSGVPEREEVARLNARMFFLHGEDPATGSASGCAAAWMRMYD